jgi:hypothetical protein
MVAMKFSALNSLLKWMFNDSDAGVKYPTKVVGYMRAKPFTSGSAYTPAAISDVVEDNNTFSRILISHEAGVQPRKINKYFKSTRFCKTSDSTQARVTANPTNQWWVYCGVWNEDTTTAYVTMYVTITYYCKFSDLKFICSILNFLYISSDLYGHM